MKKFFAVSAVLFLVTPVFAQNTVTTRRHSDPPVAHEPTLQTPYPPAHDTRLTDPLPYPTVPTHNPFMACMNSLPPHISYWQGANYCDVQAARIREYTTPIPNYYGYGGHVGLFGGTTYGYNPYGLYYFGMSDEQKIRIPEFCARAPQDRICTEGKIKFNDQELFGTVRALIQKAGFASDTKVVAIAVPLDAQDQPTTGIDEKGPVTAHNNFFNNPVRMTKGRYKLVFRLQDQYFSTMVTIRSEYENKLQDQVIPVSPDRFSTDPVIGSILQRNMQKTPADDFMRGRI